MATFNVSSNTTWDTLTGGSVNATLDIYNISNGAVLKIDSDSFHCANHSTAFGSLDTVAFAGIGGELLADGTSVRLIPFTGGSGNVPAFNTAISQGGVSSTLLGVWASFIVAPTAVGAAMPASGYIKVKNKSGGNFGAGVLTGITATSSGADVAGWIEIRGADTATITVPRVGKFRVIGDWLELGTTNGARGQVLACPTCETVAGVFAGVWVETSAGSGVYEIYEGVGSMVNSASNPTDQRGKVVWQTTGGIRFGSDGTNNVGFLPPSGCKVRIPNVIFTCCTRTVSGSGARVLPNAALATRQEFVTTSAGAIDIRNAVMQWYANFSQPFSVVARDSAFNDTLVLSEVASPLDVDNVVVAPTQAQLNFALNAVSCFAGGTIQNSSFVRFSLAASGAYVSSANFLTGVTFSSVKAKTLTNRANATTGTWTSTQTVNCTWLNCTNIGGRMALVGAQKPNITNLKYADNFLGTTGTGNAHYTIDATTGTNELTIEGMSFVTTNTHPYNGLAVVTASYKTLIKNIGTFASPLNLGSANQSAYIAVGNGNNSEITIKRCYCSNTRTGIFTFLNSDTNILLENVAGDYADANSIASLNTIAKSIGMTGINTGQVSVYGTHFWDGFTSATAGRVIVLCNEPTASSAAQCIASAGTPRFNSSGSVLLTSIGDQITWEMPYFAKGHTAFANLAATLTGTNTGNLTYQYQLDTGSGFGILKTLNGANLSAETISPSSGFKLRIIATCATANAGNLLTNILITTVTTSAAQSTNQYPLATVTMTIAANVTLAGAEIRVYDLDNSPSGSLGTELAGTESNGSSQFSFTGDVGNSVWLQIMKNGYTEFNQQIILPSTATTITVLLEQERNT